MTTTAEFIAGFEGYAGRAYWDVNAWRLGYGSDTEGPDQVHVTEGMETTKARALQNLALRIPQFQQEAIYGKTGMTRPVWDKLTENQKTAITSLVYNYGRLPIVITPSDPEKTAAAIRALQNANGGVNRKRRISEAAFYLTADVPSPQAVPQAIPQPAAPSMPIPIQPAPAPPAVLPPMSAPTAGRIAAVLDNLTALHASYVAERASIDAEIAILETTIADFGKLQGATSPLPTLLQKPAAIQAAQPQGSPIMNPQVLATIRSVLLAFGGAAVSKGVIDESTMTSLVGGVTAAASFGWSLWTHNTTNTIAAAASLPEVQKVVTTPAIADSPKFAANNRVVAN